MVAQAKSIQTVVTTPFDARDQFRARPRSYKLSSVASAQVKPARAPSRRVTAIDSNPNALSPRRPHQRRGRPPLLRLLLKALPAIAMSRVQHGKQNAHRCLTPGGNPGRGGAWSEGRGIRLRVR